MTQTVFDNAMVAHVWAQRSQPEGRSHNGNFSFEGDTLYSYSTPIGRFVTIGKDRSRYAVLVTSRSFSMTTSSKHMPALWQALRGGGYAAEFIVPELGGYYAESPNDSEHEANLAHLVAKYNDRATQVQRARDIYFDEATFAEELEAQAQRVARYAELFDLSFTLDDPAVIAKRVFAARAAREAKANTPAAIAKREKARAQREAGKARKLELERAEGAERIAAWKLGENVALRHGERIDAAEGALLRIKGDNLETSLGATVPLAEAVRVFRFVKLCRTVESDDPNDARHSMSIVWKRNGANVPVGHFQLDWISATGTFRAGCHLIHWSEIEQAAKAAGVFDVEPSDEAVTREAA